MEEVEDFVYKDALPEWKEKQKWIKIELEGNPYGKGKYAARPGPGIPGIQYVRDLKRAIQMEKEEKKRQEKMRKDRG